MALILVPASYVVKGDPSTSYILRAMGVSFSVCGVIGAINIPKVGLLLCLLLTLRACLTI